MIFGVFPIPFHTRIAVAFMYRSPPALDSLREGYRC
jgi:hypothetical protein